MGRTKHVSVDVYTLNLFIEICLFTSSQVFWWSSAPGALSTPVTSVVLYLLTRTTLMSPGKDETRVYGYIRSEFIHCVLFVHHTTSILAKLSTRCFEHSGGISCSLLVNPSRTDESWEGRNTCLWMYTLWIYSLRFVCSPHHKYFGEAQHLVLWAHRWHQLFSTR